jgi:hypothetical protein
MEKKNLPKAKNDCNFLQVPGPIMRACRYLKYDKEPCAQDVHIKHDNYFFQRLLVHVKCFSQLLNKHLTYPK